MFFTFTFLIAMVFIGKQVADMRFYIRRSLLFTALIFLSIVSFSQSISGSVSMLETDASLGYATVDIYKADKLIASVLTDRSGNFNVKLDTGTYEARINYAGFKTITKTIEVKKDEKADFGLKKDAKSKFSVVESKEEADDDRGDMSKSRAESMDAMMVLGSSPDPSSSSRISRGIVPRMPNPGPIGEAGKLTAGEINDFSKWNLWKDITSQELTIHQISWKFHAQERYTIQITSSNGTPLADIAVKLVNKAGKEFFASRTDNTGKAELWKSLAYGTTIISERLDIVANYKGKEYRIPRAKQAEKGLNTLELDVTCNQSQKVDIAFVVDATGSMSDELSFLTAEMNDVMFQAKQISTRLNFSFANVFYRDRGDAYLTRTQDFTRVLSESVAFVSEQRAGGGGDFPEAVDVALDSAINGLSWSEDARTRIVFLILDAPPHSTSAIQERLQLMSKQAARRGIRIVPLVASGIDKATEYLMRNMALATNGTYAFLTDDSGIGESHLAPSTDSYKVELLNDLLVRIIKSYTYMPDCQQEIPSLDLEYPDSLVVVDSDLSDSATTAKPKQISWKYYPNPTRGILNIIASEPISELYISDLSGKVLQVLKDIKANETVRVDLSEYASGYYLIRYPVGKQWVSGKIMLVR